MIKAADGSTDEEIVRALGVGVATIERVRKRFEERGLDGLNDLPRPGNKPKLDAKAEAIDRRSL
ncbi:MAG: helix-turn-helix domain-containing protein [Acidobacteria bacterium]|nr:helix-turn-helix domain-containing protein [Acidobacteriota bacterium]